jgi:hypothetical protein
MGTKNKDEPKPPTVPRISAKKAKKMKRGRFAKGNSFKDVVSKVTPLISSEVFFVLGGPSIQFSLHSNHSGTTPQKTNS